MKRWQIVYGLPLEVWVEIFSFPWISRREFGQLVDRIGNFKFTEHAQFFLHEWGKRSLGEVSLDQYGLFKFLKPEYIIHRLDMPQTPLPENFKSFDSFTIGHFDARTMDFLGQIRALLTNVELLLNGECRTVLTNLMPFLDGIHTMRCEESIFTWMMEHFRQNLTKLKVLKIAHFKSSEIKQDNVILNWLIQPDQEGDNGPKLCEFRLFENHGIYEQILRAIRQTPRTFAVNLVFCYWEGQVAGFHLENGIGEELQGVWNGNDGGYERIFQITRHQANCGMELQEWIKQNTKEENRGSINYSQNYALIPCCPNGCVVRSATLDPVDDSSDEFDILVQHFAYQ